MCVFKDFSLIVYFCFYCHANIRVVNSVSTKIWKFNLFCFSFSSFYPNSSVLKETNSFIYFLKLPINYLRSYSHDYFTGKLKLSIECREIGDVAGQNWDLLELEFSGYWSEPSPDNDWWKRIFPRLLGFLLKETREETYFSFFPWVALNSNSHSAFPGTSSSRSSWGLSCHLWI